MSSQAQNLHRRTGADTLQVDTPQTRTPQTGTPQTQTSQTDEAQTYTPHTDAPNNGERHPMVTPEAGHQSSNDQPQVVHSEDTITNPRRTMSSEAASAGSDQDGEALASNLCVQLNKTNLWPFSSSNDVGVCSNQINSNTI